MKRYPQCARRNNCLCRNVVLQMSISSSTVICCCVIKSCSTPGDPMDCSMPGFSVRHHLSEFAQTYVLWVSDAIQASHPLPPPCPLALNLSQHQGLFQWVSSWHQVAQGLELQLQHQSFQWIFRVHFLSDWLVWSPCSPRILKSLLQHHNSKASIFWHSAFLMVQLSHLYMTGKNHSFDSMTSVCKMMSLLFNKLSFVAFPGGASSKEPTCQCTRHKRWGFNPWVGKIHWRRKWQPIPVFLLGESYGQRSLAGYRVHEVTKSWTWLK